MNRTREKSMKELQEVGLRIYDLHLFLDTHPESVEALCEYKEMTKKYKLMQEYYEKLYGPLTPMCDNDTEYWTWIKGPWPWQNYRKENKEAENNVGL